jgi:lipoprotein-releasing system permease protein
MVSHATIHGVGDNPAEWQGLVERAEKNPHVVGAAPYIQGEVMLTNAGRVSGSLIRGIVPAYEERVAEIEDKMVVGDLNALKPGEYGIVLGRDLATMLQAEVGDKVTMVTPEATISVAGVLPRLKRFTVVGIFQSGMYEYDRAVAFIDMDDAAKVFRQPGISGIRLKFDDLMAAPWLARQVAAELPGYYSVRDWTVQHYNFFRAVRTEKTVMFVILTLIVAVAAFNIVSTLVMVVTDKQADIAILRTLGISPASVMGIFMVQGAIIGVVGTLLGVICGVALALNVETIVPFIEHLVGVQFLPGDVYPISEMPSDLRAQDVGRIAGIALLLSLLATLYPAWRASRTAPAEALRYE